MIYFTKAPDHVLDMKGSYTSNRRKTPVDVLNMLDAFIDSGIEVAEVVNWEECYNSSHSCYTALHKQCVARKLPIETIYRGGRVYLHRF